MQDKVKLFPVKSANIAAERFFYQLAELNDAEIEWVNLLIDRASNEQLRDFHRETLNTFQLVYRLRNRIQNASELSKEGFEMMSKELDIAEKMHGERWHGFIENMAQVSLEELKKCSADFYNDKVEGNHFIHFISQQFFRTPKLRAMQIRKYHPMWHRGLDLDKTWFIESQIFAMNMCVGILISKDLYKFKFLHNANKVPFLTSDQPVISLGADNEGMRLYYPLKPNLAGLFEKDTNAALKSEKNIGVMELEFYNNKIYQQSYNQLYCNSADYLKEIISIPKNVIDKW
ncbi:hypothetical protein PMNALOAF_2774 [Methylobacterium adhaesivum]|nr:hypothetical protein PMNALOAF_2774 [Methylobacterium adhaesivum]